jgi:hypothetical protein
MLLIPQALTHLKIVGANSGRQNAALYGSQSTC